MQLPKVSPQFLSSRPTTSLNMPLRKKSSSKAAPPTGSLVIDPTPTPAPKPKVKGQRQAETQTTTVDAPPAPTPRPSNPTTLKPALASSHTVQKFTVKMVAYIGHHTVSPDACSGHML
ncbi:hypothetical protein BS17DRAFT_817941 [Gyrodon lividus]|nr:hypothetical protein BS17DRAFT_817941 [Gyrodon lividus]